MFQQVTIVGRLGADPEMRYSANGNAVTNFRVAADSGFGENKSTEWFRVVTFKGTAEACGQYLSKGSLVMVIGRFQTRSWEDNGQKKYMTEVLADNVRFLDPRGRDHEGLPVRDAYIGDIDPDNLPF